jgi:hypothetical protein
MEGGLRIRSKTNLMKSPRYVGIGIFSDARSSGKSPLRLVLLRSEINGSNGKSPLLDWAQ